MWGKISEHFITRDGLAWCRALQMRLLRSRRLIPWREGFLATPVLVCAFQTHQMKAPSEAKAFVSSTRSLLVVVSAQLCQDGWKHFIPRSFKRLYLNVDLNAGNISSLIRSCDSTVYCGASVAQMLSHYERNHVSFRSEVVNVA